MKQELRPGDPELIGPYRLRGRLGAGGMGQVYLGPSPGGRAVAVKVIRAELAQDREFRARFRREVAVARQVSGLYTAPVLDADADACEPWLVTAYVPGPSLADAVTQHGPLPAPSVLMLAAGLAEGRAVHRRGPARRGGPRDPGPGLAARAGDAHVPSRRGAAGHDGNRPGGGGRRSRARWRGGAAAAAGALASVRRGGGPGRPGRGRERGGFRADRSLGHAVPSARQVAGAAAPAAAAPASRGPAVSSASSAPASSSPAAATPRTSPSQAAPTYAAPTYVPPSTPAASPSWPPTSAPPSSTSASPVTSPGPSGSSSSATPPPTSFPDIASSARGGTRY